MAKKIIDFALDLETLSKRPTAAIIEVACKRFDFTDLGDNYVPFSEVVNATSCAMYGLSFDEDTCKWWADKKDYEKVRFIKEAQGLREVLGKLSTYIEDAISESKADGIRVWCQGTDFDIAILRNAYRAVYGNDVTPWKYDEVRCARTYIKESVRLLDPNLDNCYDYIPKREGWAKHEALSDCENLIHNVRYVYRKLNEKVMTA